MAPVSAVKTGRGLLASQIIGGTVMPRICADNYPYCCVDCARGGYAIYVLDDGPCNRGCDPDAFVPRIAGMRTEDLLSLRTSGRIWNYPIRHFGPFANRLLRTGLPYATELRELGRLSRFPPRRVHATWENRNIEDFLTILVEAGGGLLRS